MKLKIVFNQKSCWLRRAVVSAHVSKHRTLTTQIQTQLADNNKVGLKEFHKEFNRLERRHLQTIQTLNKHEAIKKCN